MRECLSRTLFHILLSAYSHWLLSSMACLCSADEANSTVSTVVLGVCRFHRGAGRIPAAFLDTSGMYR